MKVVYSENYELALGGHPWHTAKYRLVLERLLAEGLVSPADVVEAPLADDEDVARAHTLEYTRKLSEMDFTDQEFMRMELPVTTKVVDVFWRSAGGTIRASELALDEGLCVHLGGGFHHAFPAYGSGFCLINDMAVSLRALLDRGQIESAAVIDADLHQGDGTARIFRDDPRVFTLSLHQRRAFPHPKQRSTLDIELEDGTADGEYLDALASGLGAVFGDGRRYDLVHYQAGADPYGHDKLGGLRLSIGGLLARDRSVFRACREAGTPVVVTLGGGYAPDIEDVVEIHVNTVRAALQLLPGTSRPESA